MKILLLTHNPISTNNNMGKTFLALFSEFPEAELCQLYIYPSIPDVEKCGSYYRITDKDVLRSYLGCPIQGKRIKPNINVDPYRKTVLENEGDLRLYGNPRNKKPFRMLLRDMMWRFSRWYTKDLQEWLSQEAPTHIFVAPGPSKFLYDMALRISKDRNLPVVTYICDDYYFVKPGKNLLEKCYIHGLREKIDKLLARSTHLVAICEEIKESYVQQFSLPADVIMTGSSWKQNADATRESIQSLSYFGNIRSGRYRSLAEIGRQLDQINAERGTNYQLMLYTGEQNEDILSVLAEIGSIKLCGFVSGGAYTAAFNNAEVLVHVEDFAEDNIDFVKHSVSTKIADSLACGKPLFAYGPDCVASMGHLIHNDCAITATFSGELRNKLEMLFGDKEERARVVANAMKTAEKYHDLGRNSKKLHSIFEGIKNE